MQLQDFLELHPQDQAVYFTEATMEECREIIEQGDPVVLAEFFEHLETDDAASIFAKYDINIIIEIINSMNSDDVTRIFREVDPLTRNRYLSLIDKIHAQKIREILQYEEDTAGGIMEKSFFFIKSKHTVKRAKEILLELAPTIGNISYMYILTPRYELIGVLSLKDLLLASDNHLITDIMTTDIKTVDVNSDVITAATVVRDYDFIALPVVNENNQMQGLITVDDIIDVITDEARENIEQISGVDTEASETHFWGNIRLRLPWLLLLLLMTMFNSQVYGIFNGVLAHNPVLSIYMPLVAAMSGNVGTQSLGLTIYRLSQDEEFETFGAMLKYAFGEARVYFAISFILSTLIFVVMGLVFKQVHLALTLCLTILLTFVISACLGTLIPIILDKLKINSQVASGPLITTVNDLISVVTYLTIGSMLM